MQRKTKEHSPGELVDLILNNDYTVYLANGWKISRRMVSGEHRIEVTGNDLYHYANQLEQEGVFREELNTLRDSLSLPVIMQQRYWAT